MRHKQQPSDEEIRSYMNFNALMEKRKAASNTVQTHAILKWSIPLVVAAALAIWFFAKEDSRSVIQGEKIKPVLPLKTDSVVEAADSITESHLQRPSNDPVPTVEKNDNHKVNERDRAVVKEKTTSKAPADEDSPVLPNEESAYKQAEPVNGYADLYQYFDARLVYPAAALQDSIQGVQTISFIVNKDGKPEQVEVVNSLGEPFEKEAKRLVENMPPWKPATLNGKPVASKVSLPITFQIKKIKY